MEYQRGFDDDREEENNCSSTSHGGSTIVKECTVPSKILKVLKSGIPKKDFADCSANTQEIKSLPFLLFLLPI